MRLSALKSGQYEANQDELVTLPKSCLSKYTRWVGTHPPPGGKCDPSEETAPLRLCYMTFRGVGMLEWITASARNKSRLEQEAQGGLESLLQGISNSPMTISWT